MLGDVLSEQRPKHWSHSYGHIRRHAYDTTGLPIKLVNNIPNHRCISYKNGLNNHHVGEGSWNVAWDVRPARWIHRPHNVWFIFGGPLVEVNPTCSSKVVVKDDNHDHENVDHGGVLDKPDTYKVTGIVYNYPLIFSNSWNFINE